MTKDEALKLALEALIRADRISGYPNNKDTITAIKEALAQPVTMILPPITEPTTKSKPIYIMGSYVGTGEVVSVTTGGVSFTGNGTAGREADVKPTGFFIQADKIGTYTSDSPEHQKLDLSLCDAKRVQLPVGEVYGWHGVGVGQPLCRFNVTESDMPVGSLLYTTPPQRKPLTDEQIEDEWERITGHSIWGGDRAEGRTMYISPNEVIEFAQSIQTNGEAK